MGQEQFRHRGYDLLAGNQEKPSIDHTNMGQNTNNGVNVHLVLSRTCEAFEGPLSAWKGKARFRQAF